MSETVGSAVLIVDDDSGVRELLALAIDVELELPVERAESAVRALEIARSRPLTLAIIDLIMPGLDGFALCRALRAEPATRDLPILVVTAARRPEDRSDALAAGATDYLAKPFDLDDLLARVRRLRDESHNS